MIALGLAVGVLLLSLQHEELWRWYAQTQKRLLELEDYIAHLDKVWQFFGAVMLLFAVKSFFPIYAVTASSAASSPRANQKSGEAGESALSPMLINASVPGMIPMADAAR